MAWIETVPEDQWEGDLAMLLERVIDPTHRRVDNIMQVHSLNPASLEAHDSLYRSAMAGTSSLRKVEREMVALVVSLINDCHY
jgi:alkylhydroperoxidase family enzyme